MVKNMAELGNTQVGLHYEIEGGKKRRVRFVSQKRWKADTKYSAGLGIKTMRGGHHKEKYQKDLESE